MLQHNVTRYREMFYAKKSFQERIAATDKNAHPTAAVECPSYGRCRLGILARPWLPRF